MVRSSTVMRGTGDAAGLEMEDIQDHREEAVDDNDEHDGGDDGRCCREPHGRRAPPRLHAPQTADERDQDAEHGALADAYEEVGEAHGAARLLVVLGGAETEHAEPYDRAAQDSEEV